MKLLYRYRHNNIVFRFFRYVALACIVGSSIIIIYASSSLGTNKVASYIDPKYYLGLPFGYHSHWIQPWRAYLETIPAHKFLDGVGIVFNLNLKKTDINPDLIADMLARHGVKQARLEINWNRVNYDDQTKINNPEEIVPNLLALKKHKLRPLILLNANDGAPCPMKVFRKKLSRNADVGDLEIRLNNTDGIIPNYTGLSHITKKSWAAEILITEVNGDWVTLSKPMPEFMSVGTSLNMATLKYRPFSAPDSLGYQERRKGGT